MNTKAIKGVLFFAWRRFGLAGFFCLGFAAMLCGQSPLSEAPSFSLDAKELLQAASGVPKEENADVIILLDEEINSIDEAGRARQTTHMIYRVDTARGVDEWASVGSQYLPWHQSRPTLRARVITPDGAQHDLDPATLTDSAIRDDSQNVYSDRHIYEGPLPAVSLGCVVEIEFVIDDTAPLFQGSWSGSYIIGREQPVLRTRFTVEIPTSSSLQYKVQLAPDIKVKKSEAGGKTLYSFSYGRTESFDPLPMLPPETPRFPGIILTTANSWHDLALQYWKRTEPQIRPDEVKTLVADLKARDKTTVEKLLARVHANARYTGLELGEASLTPQPPSETLKRKYGDCKDKATLLVSMLRAIGMPAQLALLSAGSGKDIHPEVPGLTFFNHAIVYIPDQDMFIDATAEYSRLGELPDGDQDRWALIIAENTTELKRTPLFPSSSNRSVEKREFFLQDYGPARVIETTQWFGNQESYYRSSYSGGEDKDYKKNLDDYAQSTYLADSVAKYEHGDSNDYSRPFNLRLEIPNAKRGNTGLGDAVVAIRLIDMVAAQVPREFQKEEKEKDKKADDTEVSEQIDKPRTDDWYLGEILQSEWQYRVIPPAGFHVRALPETKTINLGPIMLAQEFKTEADGTVEAMFRVDLVKRRYSVSEVAEIAKGMKRLRENGVLFLNFDLTANMLLQQGKVREALAELRQLAAKHPKESVHRARLARSYLSASLGEMAREEAQEAVKLGPKSAIAYETLGWVLQHDIVGRNFAKGFDSAGAVAAYRKATELDPKEPAYATSLGESLEHNSEGERYTDTAKLDEAIKVYRELKKNEAADANSVNEHLLYALAYSRRFAELRDLVAELGDAPVTRAMKILAAAGLEGASAARQKAAEITKSEKDKSDALAGAGSLALRIRMYPEAAELLAEGAVGQSNASSMANLAQVLKRVQKHESSGRNEGDPSNLILRALSAAAYPENLLELKKLMSRALFELPGDNGNDIMKKNWHLKNTTDFPLSVFIDISLTALKTTVDGDEASGYRLSAQIPGVQTLHVYVVKEDGALKILADNMELAPLGQEVFDRIARGDLKGAKVLLDWAREDRKLAGGEDPYSGPAFARIWKKNNEADPDAMRIAALALLTSAPGATKAYIREVEAIRDKAAGESERAKANEALMQAYSNVKDWAKLEQVAAELLANTESATLFRMLADAKAEQRKWEDVSKLVQQYKNKLDDEMTITLSETQAYLKQGETAKALELLKGLVDSGKGNEMAINLYGWAAVMSGKIGQEVLDVVQQTVQQPKNQQYAILHTLGCMYAVAGLSTQARQILLEAMKLDPSPNPPESSIWLGFGLLAESYGEVEAAKKLFGKVEKPKYFEPDELSSYFIAQRRIAALSARGASPAR